jgi:hypothetical protein
MMLIPVIIELSDDDEEEATIQGDHQDELRPNMRVIITSGNFLGQTGIITGFTECNRVDVLIDNSDENTERTERTEEAERTPVTLDRIVIKIYKIEE